MDMDLDRDCIASGVNTEKKNPGMLVSNGETSLSGIGMATVIGITHSPHAAPPYTRIGHAIEEDRSDSASTDTFLTALDHEKVENDDHVSVENLRTRVEDIEHQPEYVKNISSVLQSVASDVGSNVTHSLIAKHCPSLDEAESDDGREKVFIKDGDSSRYFLKSEDPYVTPPLIRRSLHSTETFDMRVEKRHYPRVVEGQNPFNAVKSFKKKLRFADAVQVFEYEVPSDNPYPAFGIVKHSEHLEIMEELAFEDEWADGSISRGTVKGKNSKRDIVKRVMGHVFKRFSTCFGNASANKNSKMESQATLDADEIM